MAVVAHGHRFAVMTRFRRQVLARAGMLLVASALTWLIPTRSGTQTVDTPAAWLGSALTELRLVGALAVLVALGVVAYVWQRRRPAEMGALAWVVAGGGLAFVSSVLILVVGMGSGPVYWWLGLAVAITSMTAQVFAALAGHGSAVLVTRRRG